MKKQIPILTILTFVAVTIYFGFNVSTLDNLASQSLDSILTVTSSYTEYTIHLSGHTDNIGSDNYNDKLSEQRVIAVKNYLIAKNIDSTQIKFDTYGKRKPTIPNTSNNNRALNRRVELTISGQKINTTPPLATSSEQQNKDAIDTPKQDNIVILNNKKELIKKRNKRRLVWTGWKTGFHWSTPRKNQNK